VILNILHYRESKSENALSFELLVDGKFIGEIVGGDNGGLSCWMIEGELPPYPEWAEGYIPSQRFVCVCQCGEWGCGHTRCQVAIEGETVRWHGFAGDVSTGKVSMEFTFSRANYDVVIADIVAKAAAERKKHR
jgi:hypothetical protein